MELHEAYEWLNKLAQCTNAPGHVKRWAEESAEIIQDFEEYDEADALEDFNTGQQSVINNIGNDAREMHRKYHVDPYEGFKQQWSERHERFKQKQKEAFEETMHNFGNFGFGGPYTQTRQESFTGFFASCTNIEEVKTKYRELAKQMHPDKGGNAEDFSRMNNQYQELIKQYT